MNPAKEKRNLQLAIDRLNGDRFKQIADKYEISIPTAYEIFTNTLSKHGIEPGEDVDTSIRKLKALLAKER